MSIAPFFDGIIEGNAHSLQHLKFPIDASCVLRDKHQQHYRRSALQIAAVLGHTSLVQQLLEQAATVDLVSNRKDDKKSTALLLAGNYENFQVLKIPFSRVWTIRVCKTITQLRSQCEYCKY